MNHPTRLPRFLFLSLYYVVVVQAVAAAAPATGPATEKRFPPLRVPAGFKATLFACDPLIEYPSVIARGPRPGSLFVAVDYMTGLGTDIVRRDEIRLVEDTDGDHYADRATVVASGFNSIQGLAYHDETLFVMHAPYLSAVPFAQGKAGPRRDLLTGLGLAPEQDQIRLHNANGVVAGHDGWLYLAVGDRGSTVTRPEGDRLVLEGGGILRCRPDGRDLHIFATGLRNIYDVALDDELNVFVRDNENDGGAYKVRVCHSFFGADHGYPYLYQERPDEALPPLADLGLGSSAGGLCYLEPRFPREFRGNLFFCEWGRAVVRYRLDRVGATFAPLKEIDFAAGAPTDPYGFKPTDLVVDADGSLFIADWADGQRPRRGRGRIYKVRYIGELEKPAPPSGAGPGCLQQFNSESYLERCRAQKDLERLGKDAGAVALEGLTRRPLEVRGRLHCIWALAKTDGKDAIEPLFTVARSDPDPRVRAQAVRALADLTDPVLAHHRLDAGPGDAALAARFAALGSGTDRRLQLEVIIALGRLRWPGFPRWLRTHLDPPDPALAHAAQWALRRAGNWPAVLELLDEPDPSPLRAVARRAVAGRFEPAVVDGLLDRLRREKQPARRREYADALTRVHRKPGPWAYWGFRTAPRPANTVAWERTPAIEEALDRVLADADLAVRGDVLPRMSREKVPARTATLGRWLRAERAADRVATLVSALADRPAAEGRPHLEWIIQDRAQAPANRIAAVGLFVSGLDAHSEDRLLPAAAAVEEGPVLTDLLRAIGSRQALRTATPLLLQKASSKDASVRAAALEALAGLGVPEARAPVRKLLDDPDVRVRAAAVLAAGKLAIPATAAPLLKLVRDPDAAVRRASLDALRRLREPRGRPAAVAALADQETALKALEFLGDLGGPAESEAVIHLARRQQSAEVLATVGKVLTAWAGQPGLSTAQRRQLSAAWADLHGASGNVLAWQVRGPVSTAAAEALTPVLIAGQLVPSGVDAVSGWRTILATGLDARTVLGPANGPENAWLAHAELSLPEGCPVEFFTAASARIEVWLNGELVFRRDRPAVLGPYPDRFETTLPKGRSRLVVRLLDAKGPTEFQLRFRRKSAAADHERLARAALSRAGNPERGRQLFLDAGKTLCIKCHRVGDQGERVGPELTGLGTRFSKIYIVESILEPSRTISPSFETVIAVLKSGKSISGVKVDENASSITLVDNQAAKHQLARADIDEVERLPISTMPEGLEKRVTEDEFVDLISYLVSLKNPQPR
jgi:putative membrane-bound dehydrogenase-like protein